MKQPTERLIGFRIHFSFYVSILFFRLRRLNKQPVCQTNGIHRNLPIFRAFGVFHRPHPRWHTSKRDKGDTQGDQGGGDKSVSAPQIDDSRDKGGRFVNQIQFTSRYASASVPVEQRSVHHRPRSPHHDKWCLRIPGLAEPDVVHRQEGPNAFWARSVKASRNR